MLRPFLLVPLVPVLALGLATLARADESTLSIPAAHARIGIERVRFAGDGERVGLAGAS